MSAPTIHGRFRTVSASAMLETLGRSLTQIKDEDRLTDADLGAVLGKSEDQAAKYRGGMADMGVVSLLRGAREWDGRFMNEALGLVGMKMLPLDVGVGSDRATFTALTGLLHQIAAALENDGEIDDAELLAMRTELERAGSHIDRLRERLKPRAVA